MDATGFPIGGGEHGLELRPEHETRDRPLRLAVIGTPRSGNTWIRGLLGYLYNLEEFAIHRPEELDWDRLPPRCVIQIHQRPEPAFNALLSRHGVRVVSPARHPLDVLISALNYAQHTDEPPRWHDADGVERTLRGATPTSPEFLQYACMNDPGAVLTFSPAWWRRPRVLKVRYEDLVDDPVPVLTGLALRIDPMIRCPVEEVVAAFTIDARRANAQVWQYHFGLGRRGIWRELVPARLAGAIAEAQRAAFEVLDYPCDPDPELDDLRAERNWFRLRVALLDRHLGDERRRHAETRMRLDGAHVRLEHRGRSWGHRARARLRRLLIATTPE